MIVGCMNLGKLLCYCLWGRCWYIWFERWLGGGGGGGGYYGMSLDTLYADMKYIREEACTCTDVHNDDKGEKNKLKKLCTYTLCA